MAKESGDSILGSLTNQVPLLLKKRADEEVVNEGGPNSLAKKVFCEDLKKKGKRKKRKVKTALDMCNGVQKDRERTIKWN